VDVRGRLTAESYFAAARLVIEAGGWVAGIDGARLTVPESLNGRVSLVAASSRELGEEIVEVLGNE
jgi:fructose-1,6-bisphosphatase/inositol monophosphatase family enzyme